MKLTTCPHCQYFGWLILHGFLYSSISNKIRGRRVFCSNRGNKKGCGQTSSILKADTLIYKNIDAETLWLYLLLISQGCNKLKAMTRAGGCYTESTVYYLFRLFIDNLSHIRTCLTRLKKPPDCPDITNPSFQTLTHLMITAEDDLCPIVWFQYHFQKDFMPGKVFPLSI